MFKGRAGFSLIELMITLVIGLVIIGALIQLLLYSRENFVTQSAIARMQENGQFALHYLSQDIRNSDFWGCLGAKSALVNQLNGADDYSPALMGTTDLVHDQDTLTIRGALAVSGQNQLIAPYPSSSTSPLMIASPSGIKEGDIVLVSDCLRGDIFQVTNPSAGGGLLAHVAGVGKPGNRSSALSTVYGQSASLYFPYTHTYSIGSNEQGRPSLYLTTAQNSQILVDNIENLVVLYGEDVDGDGSPDRFVRASAVTDMNQVVALRLSLVAVSDSDLLVPSPQAYQVGTKTWMPTDRRLRRVYTLTIDLPNRH